MTPDHVHSTIKAWTIGDGLPVVADLRKSNGSYLYDSKNKRWLLDCFSMHAGMPLGWNDPYLKHYLRDKKYTLLHKVSNPDIYTEEYAEFVEAMAEVTPDFQYLFFIDGGCLAVENALKVAFDWKAQKLGLDPEDNPSFNVIHLKEAFHGRSGYCLSLTNTGLAKTKHFPRFHWTRIPNPKMGHPSVYTVEAEAIAVATNACHDTHRPVAAIIIEPVQGEGGDNHFRPDFHRELRRLADEYEAMLIYDEVQTGLGLTGKMWAYQHFGIKPDIICFGKKTQVAGIACSDRVDEVKSHCFNESSRLNSTWGGNLCDMVRATAILKVIKRMNLVQRAEAVGEYFTKQLRGLGLDNVRGRGLMIAFDMESQEERDAFLAKLSEKMLALKCGERSVRFRPHLTFGLQHADHAVQIIKWALGRTGDITPDPARWMGVRRSAPNAGVDTAVTVDDTPRFADESPTTLA